MKHIIEQLTNAFKQQNKPQIEELYNQLTQAVGVDGAKEIVYNTISQIDQPAQAPAQAQAQGAPPQQAEVLNAPSEELVQNVLTQATGGLPVNPAVQQPSALNVAPVGPVAAPIEQPIEQPINQPIEQPINQPIEQPIKTSSNKEFLIAPGTLNSEGKEIKPLSTKLAGTIFKKYKEEKITQMSAKISEFENTEGPLAAYKDVFNSAANTFGAASAGVVHAHLLKTDPTYRKLVKEELKGRNMGSSLLFNRKKK